MRTRAACYGDYVRVRPRSLMEQLAHRSPLVNAQDHVRQQRRDGNDGNLVAGQSALSQRRSPRCRSRRPQPARFRGCDRTLDRRERRGWRRQPHPARPARGRSWPREPACRRCRSRRPRRSTLWPSTSPIRLNISVRAPSSERRFSTIASGTSSRSAKLRAAAQRPDVRRDDDRVRDGVHLKVIDEQPKGRQLVNGDGKEALNLLGVQVEGDDPVGARRLRSGRRPGGR